MSTNDLTEAQLIASLSGLGFDTAEINEINQYLTGHGFNTLVTQTGAFPSFPPFRRPWNSGCLPRAATSSTVRRWAIRRCMRCSSATA